VPIRTPNPPRHPPARADEHDRRSPKPDAPERALWRRSAELPTRVEVPSGFGVKRRSLEDKAREVVGPLVRGMTQLVKDDPALPARKLMYLEMGCRGDWPQLMPPEWNPATGRPGATEALKGGGGGGGAAAEGGAQPPPPPPQQQQQQQQAGAA
jgi:hypothetical protein